MHMLEQNLFIACEMFAIVFVFAFIVRDSFHNFNGKNMKRIDLSRIKSINFEIK